MSLTLTLPLPPRELHPNARVHWRPKAAATAGYRLLAKARSLEALGLETLPAVLEELDGQMRAGDTPRAAAEAAKRPAQLGLL